MFTGLIEAQGKLSTAQKSGGDLKVKISSSTLDFSDVALGDSIATNGVCLTVVKLEQNAFWADVSNETLKLSTFTSLRIGAVVNLEKAMLPTTRFGGHMVSGHIDGIAEIKQLARDARSIVIRIAPPAELLRYIAPKGSVCIDGVSLTVNEVVGSDFLLNIVPHTAKKTKLDSYKIGDRVNIEVDLVARYLERLLVSSEPTKTSGITLDLLSRSGFARR